MRSAVLHYSKHRLPSLSIIVIIIHSKEILVESCNIHVHVTLSPLSLLLSLMFRKVEVLIYGILQVFISVESPLNVILL